MTNLREGLQQIPEPLRIEGEIGATYTPTEIALPHGGGCQSLATYQTFPYTTYTLDGRQVNIDEISGYKCDDCGFTFFLSEVFEEMEATINAAEQL